MAKPVGPCPVKVENILEFGQICQAPKHPAPRGPMSFSGNIRAPFPGGLLCAPLWRYSPSSYTTPQLNPFDTSGRLTESCR